MLAVERRREELEYIRAHRAARVEELARVLAVSPQTVRRDLATLAGRGLVARVHGGAVATPPEPAEGPAAERGLQHVEEKRRIAAAAAELLADGDIAFVSGGTTTERLVPFLDCGRRLTVVTNALNIAHALTRHPRVDVIVLSGYLRHSEMSLLGHLAEQGVEALHLDWALFGTYGIDPQVGLTAASLPEVSLDRRVIARADRLAVLADHSKFDQRGSLLLAAVEEIDIVVTDGGAPRAALTALEARGVRVVRA